MGVWVEIVCFRVRLIGVRNRLKGARSLEIERLGVGFHFAGAGVDAELNWLVYGRMGGILSRSALKLTGTLKLSGRMRCSQG